MLHAVLEGKITDMNEGVYLALGFASVICNFSAKKIREAAKNFKGVGQVELWT